MLYVSSTPMLLHENAPAQKALGSKMLLCGKTVHSWCEGSSGQSFMVDPLSYFSMPGVTKAEICVIQSTGYKRTLAANWKE